MKPSALLSTLLLTSLTTAAPLHLQKRQGLGGGAIAFAIPLSIEYAPWVEKARDTFANGFVDGYIGLRDAAKRGLSSFADTIKDMYRERGPSWLKKVVQDERGSNPNCRDGRATERFKEGSLDPGKRDWRDMSCENQAKRAEN
ncbi:hypothetical protein GQ602_001998 [Ophiocordyceps camponoti-floridani]|uniref:Uncharacterized protein n=1 Tax=Ophiocordyceps camponoti-floridani TaxID=2030778 RepID=A0A8H4Q9J0_9HYPO|nr:hypothetical protein GQ602_001998 [Ophiocordyceps camponoti-floridani]